MVPVRGRKDKVNTMSVVSSLIAKAEDGVEEKIVADVEAQVRSVVTQKVADGAAELAAIVAEVQAQADAIISTAVARAVDAIPVVGTVLEPFVAPAIVAKTDPIVNSWITALAHQAFNEVSRVMLVTVPPAGAPSNPVNPYPAVAAPAAVPADVAKSSKSNGE